MSECDYLLRVDRLPPDFRAVDRFAPPDDVLREREPALADRLDVERDRLPLEPLFAVLRPRELLEPFEAVRLRELLELFEAVRLPLERFRGEVPLVAAFWIASTASARSGKP